MSYIVRFSPGFRFLRSFEVPDEKGRPCKVAHWTDEPIDAMCFTSVEEADRARDAWHDPSAPGLGIVAANDPFGRASYRRFEDGKRVE